MIRRRKVGLVVGAICLFLIGNAIGNWRLYHRVSQSGVVVSLPLRKYAVIATWWAAIGSSVCLIVWVRMLRVSRTEKKKD